MDNFKKLLILLWVFFFIFLFFQVYSLYKYYRYLQELKKKPLDENLKKYIENLPEYKKLTQKQKKILEYKIQRFIEEKQFIGIGLEITDEIKVLTAFYACLPTIAYINFCYPSLEYIYIYPNVIVKQKEGNFIKSNEKILISGEAVGEFVVLVWNEAKREIYHNMGRNVIIHEFAHELDFEEGMIDGIPPIEKSMMNEWTKIMYGEYKKFKNRVLKNRFLGRYSFLDKYAATNEAEFFAVISEYFFKKPEILKKHFPDIYEELKKFYKVEFI